MLALAMSHKNTDKITTFILKYLSNNTPTLPLHQIPSESQKRTFIEDPVDIL
uniref:Uncharacterized protein n=1 Tax=Arion vulgaris TaxID=1028688 RepID=A0A0B6YCA8_9EUPU